MALVQSFADIFNPGSNVIDFPKEWPPFEETARLDRYDQHRLIYEGKHEIALDERQLAGDYGTFITCNLPALVVRVFADFLAGEDLALEFGGDVPEEAQQRVHDIWDRNELQTMLHESAVEGGHQGDAIFTVGRDEEGLSVVDTAQARHWFPVTHPDRVREVLLHKLCWVKTAVVDGKERDYLRVVEHHRGRVENKLFLMENERVMGEAGDDAWRMFYGDEVPQAIIETGVDDFLVVHVPTYRVPSKIHGASEFSGQESLFAALDARLTQLDHILSKHADPPWSLPPEAFDALTQKHGPNVPLDAFRILKQSENGDDPKRIIWDAHLDSLFKAIDELTDKILMTSEIDPQLMGRGDFGGDISGRALKLRLMRTLSKVNRRRRYYDAGLKQILRLAQMVEGVEPIDVEIKWPDGLPNDLMESVEIASARIAAGLSSPKREIKRLDNLTDEEAQVVVDEINEADGAPLSQAAARRGAPQINVTREAVESL